MMWFFIVIAVGFSLWELPAFAADEIFPSDPRIIQANALLSDESEWNTAIALYEEVLADDPDHVAARNWLARVHSWKGNYELSFTHYDVLLARQNPPPDARIERAEVLSWAGEYTEAETEFEAILAKEPANERAARGLILAYHWSGRAKDAQSAYQRALSTEEGDPSEEMLKLKTELDSNLSTQVDSNSSYFADSDGFRRFRVQIGAHHDVDHQTRLLVTTSYIGVRSDLNDAALRDSDDGVDVFAGVERRFGDRLRVNARVGFRHWSNSADRVLFRGETEYTASESLAGGVQIAYDDFLEQSNSLEALLAGLTITSGRAWVWHAFNEALSGHGYLDVGYVSDTNLRIGLGASYTYSPFNRWNVSFSWISAFLTYSERSDLYYAPVVDVTTGMSALGQLPLPHGFSLVGNIDLGFNYAREGGISGVGVAFGVEAGPTWTHRSGYFLSLRARYSRSQRASAYDSGGAWLSFGRGL